MIGALSNIAAYVCEFPELWVSEMDHPPALRAARAQGREGHVKAYEHPVHAKPPG